MKLWDRNYHWALLTIDSANHIRVQSWIVDLIGNIHKPGVGPVLTAIEWKLLNL